MRLTTIVSGGQSGADRGGLDAAIELDLAYGGWAPAGWRAEDGEIPEVYRSRMRCTSSSNYGMRTRLNIQDSDGTLVVSFAESPGGGTAYTIEQCECMDKSHIHVVLPRGGRTAMPDAIASGVLEWLNKAQITVLNVAGPRESKEPGIQEAVRDLLVWVLEDEIAVLEVHESLHLDANGEVDHHDTIRLPTRDEVWQGLFGATNASSPAAAGSSDAGTPPQVSPDGRGPAAAAVAPAKWRSGPLQKTTHIPALHGAGEGDKLGSFTVRLYFKSDEEVGSDGVTWVDFELFEVTSISHPSGEVGYEHKGGRGGPDTTERIDDAESIADGFVKWDGCTQFEMGDVHVDSREQLENLWHGINEARRLCAAEMTGYDRSEYT